MYTCITLDERSHTRNSIKTGRWTCYLWSLSTTKTSVKTDSSLHSPLSVACLFICCSYFLHLFHQSKLISINTLLSSLLYLNLLYIICIVYYTYMGLTHWVMVESHRWLMNGIKYPFYTILASRYVHSVTFN